MERPLSECGARLFRGTPNKAFSEFTGYAPGEKCSRRDLILDLSNALNSKGVKLICYFAGLNGYMKEPKVLAGLMDQAAGRGEFNDKTMPSAECRNRRLRVLKEYADRFQSKTAGWWFWMRPCIALIWIAPTGFQPTSWWDRLLS